MATSLEILASIAPQVAARADVDLLIELAEENLTQSKWGNKYAHAVALLAAHQAALAPVDEDDAAEAAGVAGPVTSRSAGDLAESYGSASSGVSGITVGDASLMTTSYGREFIRLRQSRAARAPRVFRI